LGIKERSYKPAAIP